jgi:hypothetical protein
MMIMMVSNGTLLRQQGFFIRMTDHAFSLPGI